MLKTILFAVLMACSTVSFADSFQIQYHGRNGSVVVQRDEYRPRYGWREEDRIVNPRYHREQRQYWRYREVYRPHSAHPRDRFVWVKVPEYCYDRFGYRYICGHRWIKDWR